MFIVRRLPSRAVGKLRVVRFVLVTPEHSPVSLPVIGEYYRETWFTPEGARLKYLKLRAKGLPSLADWRFITLTVADREASPEVVYLRGKDRLRVFTRWWRETLGRDVLWCWKLELHEDGYPHWHMLVDYRKRIPTEFFCEVEAAWGLGRVNVKRVKRAEMHYVFKYVAKGLHELPSWILDRKQRTRVFQAASGFFASVPRVAKKTEKLSSVVPVSLRQQMRWDESRAIIKYTDFNGAARTLKVRLTDSFAKWFFNRLQVAITQGCPLASASSFHISEQQRAQIVYEHKHNSRGLAVLHRTIASGYHCEFASCPGSDSAGNDRFNGHVSENVGRQDADGNGNRHLRRQDHVHVENQA